MLAGLMLLLLAALQSAHAAAPTSGCDRLRPAENIETSRESDIDAKVKASMSMLTGELSGSSEQSASFTALVQSTSALDQGWALYRACVIHEQGGIDQDSYCALNKQVLGIGGSFKELMDQCAVAHAALSAIAKTPAPRTEPEATGRANRRGAAATEKAPPASAPPPADATLAPSPADDPMADLRAALTARKTMLFIGLTPLDAVGASPGLAHAFDLRLGGILATLPNVRVVQLPSVPVGGRDAALAAAGADVGVDQVLAGSCGSVGGVGMLNLERLDVERRAVSTAGYAEGDEVALWAAFPRLLRNVLLTEATSVASGRDSIKAVVAAHIADLTSCHEAALARNSTASGRITLAWDIVASGRTRNLKLVSNSTGDAALGECITAKAADWLFPAGFTASVEGYTWSFGK